MGQAFDGEDCFEIAVALDEARAGGLEVGFGELGFDKEFAKLEIDLGAVFEMLLLFRLWRICEDVGVVEE